MILADTSIWIDHFRHGDAELRRIIEDDRLLCHPVMIGGLALGSLRNRADVMVFLKAHWEAFIATHDEIMLMIDRHSIFRMGIGYSDAHLLASVLLDPRSTLWTKDKRLTIAAQKAGATLHLPVSPHN